MNYVLTIPFLIFIFVFYYEVGSFLLKICRYQDMSGEKKVLAGFIFTFFLSFVIGVPLQYKHLPWHLFLIGYSILLLLTFAIVVKFNYQDIQERMKSIRQQPWLTLWKLFKDHYLMIGLIAMFTILSMSNALAYYEMNYDDAYYIGKIVNLIGSPGLLNENYFSGALFDGFEGGISRVFNTYEITYGYFASLFGISVPFFCRCTMTIHNYIITFLAYKALASLFVKKEHSQYALSIFAIFLISAGYMYNNPLNLDVPFTIRMYDAWQLQTAMWYGVGIVRMTVIPVILVFGKDLFDALDYRKIIFMGVIYIAYMAFSSCFVPYGFFLLFGFGFLKSIQFILEDHPFIGIVGVLGCVAFLVLAYRLNGSHFTLEEDYIKNYESYSTFYTTYFDEDIIFYWMPFLMPLGLLLTKEKAKRYVIGAVVIMYIFFFSRKFDALIMRVTFNYMFVALRTWTSMQYFATFMLAVGIICLLEKMNVHQFVIMGLSYALVVYPVIFIKNHISQIEAEHFRSSGMTQLGYDLDQLTHNDEMMPDLFVEMKDYFNELPYGNYRLLVSDAIPYNQTYIEGYGVVVCSNRIEIYCHTGLNEMVKEQYQQLVSYLKNEVPLSSVQHLIDGHEIQYILVTEERQKEELIQKGYYVVMESKESNPYWLIATTYA